MCPVFWRSCGRGNRSPIVATRSSSLRNTGRPVKSRAKAADMASAPVRWSGGQTATKPKAYPLEDGCSPGTLYPVWNKGKWRFGINICNDTNYPQAADQLIRQGANLICAPINNMLRPKKAEIWRVRSVENLRGNAMTAGSVTVVRSSFSLTAPSPAVRPNLSRTSPFLIYRKLVRSKKACAAHLS
jgi:hypothetical protein